MRNNHRTSHPLYRCYSSMKTRCLNPNHPSYSHYGGRGITVCKRWLGDTGFEHFVSDMGPRTNPLYSLDRIDNDGDYEPSNCRWATPREQRLNSRLFKLAKSGYHGVYPRGNTGMWKAVIRSEMKTIQLGYFDNPKDAAKAYNEAALKYHGEYARLNVIE